MVNRLEVTGLLQGLLPTGSHCLLCGLPGIEMQAADLCADCSAELPRIGQHCPHCGLPLPDPHRTVSVPLASSPCGQCLLAPPPYRRCIAPLLYRPPVAQLIARFKYSGRLACGRLLCDELLRRLRCEPDPGADLIVPVPLHWRRRWARGFNQAEIIGDELSRALRIPLRSDLLARSRPAPPQQSLGADQRRRNLRGAFALRGPAVGLDIALVDDVVTTGATAAEIAGLLLGAGARSVQVWCLARTP
jgi:ComF family protein